MMLTTTKMSATSAPSMETGGLLPDPDHLKMVDESHYFSTQPQRLIKETGQNDEASDAEAIKNLQAALIFQKKGHIEKAMKLFKHALALSPKHPSVLNHYGEFLIEIGEDPV